MYIESLDGDGGRLQVSTGGGSAPRWSRDGQSLFFASGSQILRATLVFGDEISVSSRTLAAEGNFDLNFQVTNYDLHPETDDFLVISQSRGGQDPNLVWIQNWLEIVRAMETGR